jgi:hypothetical protein
MQVRPESTGENKGYASNASSVGAGINPAPATIRMTLVFGYRCAPGPRAQEGHWDDTRGGAVESKGRGSLRTTGNGQESPDRYFCPTWKIQGVRCKYVLNPPPDLNPMGYTRISTCHLLFVYDMIANGHPMAVISLICFLAGAKRLSDSSLFSSVGR